MQSPFTKGSFFLAASLVLVWALAGYVRQYQDEIHAEFHDRVDKVRHKIPKVKVDWHKLSSTGHFIDEESPAPSPFNRSKLALLVEPRPLPHLVPQILHMISVVPPDWKFLFIGSNQSILSVGRAWATKHQQRIGKLDLITMREPFEINSKEGIFRLMTDIRFYDEFIPDVEHLLKYEHDSIMCANSPISLNQWLSWDWTGAPRSAEDRFSGNGGLTLRRVSAIRRILKIQSRLNNTDPEDEWFGRRVLVLPGAKVASAKHGQFAVEDSYIPQPMGFHVRDGGKTLPPLVWKNQTRRQEIFRYCPELSIIMDMKLERERCPGDDGEGSLVTPTPDPAPPAAPAAPAANPAPPAPAPPPAAASPTAAAPKEPVLDADGFQVEPDSSPETKQALDEVLSNNQNFDENSDPTVAQGQQAAGNAAGSAAADDAGTVEGAEGEDEEGYGDDDDEWEWAEATAAATF